MANDVAKYVVCDLNGGERIIVFSARIRHDTFSNLNPIRAGFVGFYENKASCFGKSISLGLKSDEELDSKLVNEGILNI
jgi:hypothetical protein|tara:strand:- start:14 stop:250 length:237 start_codon:yes stop_codon:yes gene_type:complete